MKFLLDTHAFLWFIEGDVQRERHARRLIQDRDNERYLSVASVWEITIKSSLGRLVVPTPPSVLVRDHVWANAIELLAILPEHSDLAAIPVLCAFVWSAESMDQQNERIVQRASENPSDSMHLCSTPDTQPPDPAKNRHSLARGPGCGQL